MIDVQDIHSLSDFQRNTKAHLSKLRETGRPSVLTVNGKAELVVLSAASFRAMAETLARAEAIEGISRGLEEAESGQGRPIRQTIDSIRRKHRIPPKS